MALAAREIGYAMHDLMLQGIQYEKIAGEFWEMQRIEEEAEKGISRYLKNLYEVQNRDKSLFDAVEFESEVERRFAADLDANEHVKLFVKLPSWFKIDTPIGPYNPDWAFVTEREEKLYLVRESHHSQHGLKHGSIKSRLASEAPGNDETLAIAHQSDSLGNDGLGRTGYSEAWRGAVRACAGDLGKMTRAKQHFRYVTEEGRLRHATPIISLATEFPS
jgi:hypothetical protein